jgi:hypothetical protein
MAPTGLEFVQSLEWKELGPRTAVEHALESVDALVAELGADPYRRMAEIERARFAQTFPVTRR